MLTDPQYELESTHGMFKTHPAVLRIRLLEVACTFRGCAAGRCRSREEDGRNSDSRRGPLVEVRQHALPTHLQTATNSLSKCVDTIRLPIQMLTFP